MDVDSVVLRTGERVPEPLIYPTWKKLNKLSESTLDQLDLLVHGAYDISDMSQDALQELQRADLINRDLSIYPSIKNVLKASTERLRAGVYIVSPVDFPMTELLTRSEV